ncbi:MAG: serine/threonine protein kinase [Deltaproteobacteria bacterium]|jgi:hypothetical protein|nr:serine/threonine protein kinase [Deltaproteobacteria bacterium]
MKLAGRFGRYILIEKIASGGTAEVYKALQDSKSGFAKQVAIKRLFPAWKENEEMCELLFDEARALMNLQHQSIAQILDYDIVGGIPFIAMEYVDGMDLSRLLNRLILMGRPIELPHLLYVIQQILLALDFAHNAKDDSGRSLKIIHRDISPANILLSWYGEVKLTDFGIAKGVHRSRLTKIGQIRGKYSYMSPEQAAGKELDYRSDLYSLSVIMLELSIAERLFSYPNDLQILEFVKNYQLPKGVVERVPEKLRSVIRKGINRKPDGRYQDAQGMLKRIKTISKDVGISNSVDFSTYLKGEFMSGSSCDELNERNEGSRVTKEYVELRYTKKVFKVLIALLVLFLTLSVSTHNIQHVADAVTIKKVKEKKVRIGTPKGPEVQGAIAIDSDPSGAHGYLMLGDKKIDIKTPYSIEDVSLENDVRGFVQLVSDNYHPSNDEFSLSESNTVFVKKYILQPIVMSKLSVNARPWGIVEIPGYISNRETPLHSIKLNPGTHLVKVIHPPTNGRISKRINLTEGGHRRCAANFEGTPSLSCR